MGRLVMNRTEGELFILCLVVVECGRMLYTVNGYIYSYELYNGSKYTSYSIILN